MKTALKYNVLKEEKYNFKTDKIENHIVSRGFEFSVNGAKTEEEHNSIIENFAKYLDENNIEYSGFGDGTWESCKHYNDTQSFYFLYIPVVDMEEKEYIKDLYKEWKTKNKRA